MSSPAIEGTEIFIMIDKRAIFLSIALLLKGAIAAEEKVGLKMNVEEKNLQKIISILPAMKKPSHLL